MTDAFDSFEKRILSMDPAELAAIDAKVEANRRDPNYRPDPVESWDDPDPFGVDWKWLEVPDEDQSSVPQPKKSVATSAASKSQSRWKLAPSSAVGTAIAASLLIGAGMLLGGWAFRGGGWNAPAGSVDMLVASVTPKYETGRGIEDLLLLEIKSERPGFATVISLGPERSERVFPEPGEDLLQVAPATPATYGPLPADSTIALVMITETPATSIIRDALLDQDFQPHDIAGLKSYLLQLLETSGYRWTAEGRATLPQGDSR